MSSTAPPSSFSETLQFITSIKLSELEKQRQSYRNHARVLESAHAPDVTPLRRVEMLLDAVRSWSGSGALPNPWAEDPDFADKETPPVGGMIGGKLDLYNLDIWLIQARCDPSFHEAMLETWAGTLETHIKHSMRRFDCASLFGNLLNEWLASGDSNVNLSLGDDDGSEAVSSTDQFVDVGRQEMHDQREKLNSIIFEAKKVDTAAIREYMTSLFTSEDGHAEKVLATVRKRFSDYCHHLLRKPITARDITYAIKDILSSPLMSEDKRATLRQFSENPTVLEEIASVLNMRMSSLESWAWPSEGLVVEMRRHLNSKYRAFSDPSVLDAIFLHHIGVSWQVRLKEVFTDLLEDSKFWKQSSDAPLLTSRDKDIRTHCFKDNYGGSIQSTREEMREQSFSLSQLSRGVGQTPTYDDVVDTDGQGQAHGPAAIKKELLHLLATESHLNTTIHGSHAIVRSDLEWFGPSLPHESILTILGFFGVSDKWLAFIKEFLQAPLRFIEDGVNAPLKTRLRGTPISFALSAVCGEMVLFGMDLAVNQKTGLFLYRMHDDLWLWDSKPAKCAAAWEEMQNYASIVGLTVNNRKTGSAYVTPNNSTVAGLPAGDIRWGFLKYQTSSTGGRFVIDQADVDREVKELRRQLDATKSVMGWTNAWNKYMAFFVRNFGGSPAACFGRAHADDMIRTLGRIQTTLFSDHSSSGAVGHLRRLIEERFGVKDLPQGYFFFPVISGGLELRNPLIELLAMRDLVEGEPEKVFAKQVEKDQEVYKMHKETWDAQKDSRAAVQQRSRWDDNLGKINFPSFEDYVSQRETRLDAWRTVYQQMLKVPTPQSLRKSPTLAAVMSANNSAWASSLGWDNMNYYEKWITAMYGESLVESFGTIEPVDPSLIPTGMVQLFKSARMKLDQ